MWEKLNLMRQMWQLCDVTLFSDDNIMFMAHSPVLAASSEVFHNYFVKRVPTIIDELADRKLMLHGVRGDVLQVVLDFIYGVTPPTIEEFEKLKIGADALAIHGAYTYCGEKFYKSQNVMGAGKGGDDAGGRGQSVIVYSKPQSPVPVAKPKVCPVTNIPGGGRQVCPVSNILEPITGGCDDLGQVESNSFPVGGALIPSSDADGSGANLLSNDIEMRPVSGDVLPADCSASEPNEASNATLTAQMPGNAQMASPTGMNRCPVNMGNAANVNSFSPRDIRPLSSPITCPYNGETNSPVIKQDRIAPLTSDIGGKRNTWANSMLPTAPLFIPDLTPMWQSTNPGVGQNCCRSDGMPLIDLSNDMLDKSAVENSQTSGHHDLIPEMTLSDLTVQLECPHLKRIASDERIASGNSDAMKAEGGACSPKSAASPDNDYTDCSSEGSNHESCSTDRQSKFSSNFLVCNIIDAPRDPQICNDNVNDRYFRQLDEMPGATTTNNMLGRTRTLNADKTAVCKVEPPPDGATSGQSPDACSSENSNNSDTSTEVWAVHSGRPPTAEEVVENTKLLSRLKLNEKKSYTCLVDGCGYTNKHVDYMCSHMYHRHTMGLPTKHCGHCTKAYFSLG